MQINIQKLHPLAKTPTYATDGSGCFDLYATNQFTKLVHEGFPETVGTGIAVEIPVGYAMFIFSRSGQGFKFDTRLANCVGVIDSDYRGEIMVKLTRDMIDSLVVPLSIVPGDRVAQACILPVPKVAFNVVDALSSTERGAGGFGSTGA